MKFKEGDIVLTLPRPDIPPGRGNRLARIMKEYESYVVAGEPQGTAYEIIDCEDSSFMAWTEKYLKHWSELTLLERIIYGVKENAK